MASGKSTVGRLVARELGVPFVDTDALIVARAGPMAEVFARLGEAGFRNLEMEAIAAALEGPPGILSLGGGAVTHPPARALLAERTVRVYLDVPLDALLARLRRSATVRPVLGNGEPTPERVAELLRGREPFYREADIIVSGPRRSKHAFAREIAARITSHFSAGVV